MHILIFIMKKILNFPFFLYSIIKFNNINYNINYNTNIGLEEYNKEYKLFTLIHNIPLDINEAKYYCRTFKLLPNLNTYILKNLYIYIKIFLQKNIYAFLNANIKASFYIGVDDNGYVKGIPYNGRFPIYYLYMYIHFILYFCSNNNDVYKYIKINFIKVSFVKKSNYDTHVQSIYNKYIKDEKYYLNILNNYNKNYNNWLYNYKLYSRKLADLANNYENRESIINYIKNNVSTKSELKVLNIFYSSYKFENKNANEITNIKNDKYNPYYWITRWKDDICSQLMKEKPFKPMCLYYYDKMKSIPFRIINCLELIPIWSNRNKNMEVYIIHITTRKHNTNKKYLYKEQIPIRSITSNNIPYVKIIDLFN